MTDRLFVYGTLAPGRPNEHVLADVPGTWEPATVTGSLVDDGWGAALGYPGLVLDDGEDRIDGFLFTAGNLAAHWARLDAFEGDGYARVTTSARLESGEVVETWVYALSGRG